MSLGCENLTDEQLFELTQEICGELVKRDPVLRSAAQQEVYSAAEQIQVAREALNTAIEEARSEFREQLRQEAEVEVAKRVDAGEKLFDGQEEAKAIVDAHRRAVEDCANRLLCDAARYSRRALPPEAISGLIGGVARMVEQACMEFRPDPHQLPEDVSDFNMFRSAWNSMPRARPRHPANHLYPPPIPNKK